MNNIKPVIFLIPAIALILTGILYFYFLKKSTDKSTFNKFIFTVTALALLLNFIWELIQIPLYKDGRYSIDHIAFCALATLADVIMVLLLYFGLASLSKNVFWIKNPTWQRIAFLIFTGGTGAVLAEIRHLSLGTWVYADSMPIIPLINVGVSPVLQFMILPLLIYLFSMYRLKLLSNQIR